MADLEALKAKKEKIREAVVTLARAIADYPEYPPSKSRWYIMLKCLSNAMGVSWDQVKAQLPEDKAIRLADGPMPQRLWR